jgi:tetratricopeptide (TPR) repeat protein
LSLAAFCYNDEHVGGAEETDMGDTRVPSTDEKVVALLKASRRNMRSFVHGVEALAPADGDVAGFLDEAGTSLASEERWVGAMELWEKAVRMYEEQGRGDEAAHLYANMGPAAATMGDVPRGVKLSKKAADLAGETPDDHELALHVSSDLGAMYAELGRWEDAMYEFSRALEVSRVTDDLPAQARALLSLARIGVARSDVGSARSEAMGALSIGHACGDLLIQAEALQTLGDVSALAGQQEQAVREYRQAQELETQVPDPELRAQLHFALSTVFEAMGETEQAARERNLAAEAGLPEDSDNDDGDVEVG